MLILELTNIAYLLSSDEIGDGGKLPLHSNKVGIDDPQAHGIGSQKVVEAKPSPP